MKKTISAVWAFLLSSFMLCSCSETVTQPIPDIENEQAAVSEAETAAVTEAPVTAVSQEVTRKPEKPAPVVPDGTDPLIYYSALKAEPAFEDGLYQVDFLKNKDFESKINSDIKAAAEKLKENFSSEYIDYVNKKEARNANIVNSDGICTDIICRNGYLSVLLFYTVLDDYSALNPYTYNFSVGTLAGISDVTVAHAVSLNYDLLNEKKIDDFSELLSEGKDWNESLNNALQRYSENDEIYISEKPEIFTVNYILRETGYGYDVNKYCDWSLNLSSASDFRVSEYRPFASVTDEYIKILYAPYRIQNSSMCENCDERHQDDRIVSSRFFSDDIISLRNEQLKIIDEREFPHECGTEERFYRIAQVLSPEAAYMVDGINIWRFRLYGDSYDSWYFDPDTGDRLTMEMVFGEDWRDYIVSTEDGIGYSTEGTELLGHITLSDDGETVNVNLMNMGATNLEVTVYEIPEKFLTRPSGLEEYNFDESEFRNKFDWFTWY